MEDFINEISDKWIRKQAKDIEESIIRFLRKKGFKPKRTAKYANNLKKKLKKQGIILRVEEIVLEEKITGTIYYKKVGYVPSFVHIEK